MDDLDSVIDGLIDHKQAAPDEVQSIIDPDIWFRRASVNLIIGRRGSGKTYTTLHEILKLPLTGHREFTQVHYVTSKLRDDTVDKYMAAFSKLGIYFNWCPLSNAERLIDTLTRAKAMVHEQQSPEDYSMLCRALSSNPTADESTEVDVSDPTKVHTILIFDDCISVFVRNTALARKLFENRQSKIIYFLILQDVTGISPSMKSNIDSLRLFGGFPRQKWNLLTYQLPPLDITYEDYAQLSSHGYMQVDFISGETELIE